MKFLTRAYKTKLHSKSCYCLYQNQFPYYFCGFIFTALNRDDEELTGSEDPSVLHSVVANLPAQQAYKEGKWREERLF